VTVSWSPSISVGGSIDGHELQFKKQGTLRGNKWMTVPTSVAGVNSAGSTNPVQTIRCRTGHTGTFQLGLNSHKINTHDSESKTLTARIACDASTTQDVMQERLQALENVGCIHVEAPFVGADGYRNWKVQFRSDITPATNHAHGSKVKTTIHNTDREPVATFGNPAEKPTYIGATNHNGYSCPASSHGSSSIATLSYPWTLTHSGPWPLLTVQSQGTDASKVYVVRNQQPGAIGGGSLCHGNSGCMYTASNLEKNKYYVFRVRSHNPIGWSRWSGNSDPILTLGTGGDSSHTYDQHTAPVVMHGGIVSHAGKGSIQDSHVSL